MVEDVVANCTTLKTRYTEEEFAMTTQAAAVRSTSPRDDAPLFTVLERFEECESILLRNNVGQLFRIRAVEISGRKSEPSGGKKNFPRREAEDAFAGRGCRTRLSAVVADRRAGA